MKLMRRLFAKSTIVAILFVAVLSALIFAFRNEPKPSLKEDLFFHPDSVTSIYWTTPKGKEFEFSRKNRSVPWQIARGETKALPQDQGRKIQEILNQVALKTSLPGDKKTPEAKFKIIFSDGQEIAGGMTKRHLIWTTGRNQGSYPLTESQEKIFLQGEFVFDSLAWNWCEKRPQKISYSLRGEQLEIERKKLEWTVQYRGKSRTIDPTLVERWLGANCEIRFTRYIDESLQSTMSFLSFAKFRVGFEDGTFKSYSIDGENVQLHANQVGVLSPEKQPQSMFKDFVL